jgi:16S rRNA (cytosine1402-N4)-methyltransferase
MSDTHTPVLLTEAIEALQVKPDAWYIDATFGRGGHTRAILNQAGNAIAFDFDQTAIEFGQQEFAEEITEGRLILIRENFDQIHMHVSDKHISSILFDFGTSAEQLTSTSRGLSFQGADDELDMRLDDRLGVKAKDLLALLSERQLEEVFGVYGGDHEAKKIAHEIVVRRKQGEFMTTVGQLVKLVQQVKREPQHKLHPATKVFQGLRIVVNDELGNIERALPQALEILQPGGNLVTIAFHEGEDRIAKHLLKEWEQQGLGTTSKRPIEPGETELQSNPRSRSAKLRVFTKN